MKLSVIRSKAFHLQQGRCYYCGCLMWQDAPEQFAERHGVSHRQARAFQCTAEHLRARCEGGTDAGANIAAACHFCNSQRHRAAKPLEPDAYRAKVRQRMINGRWHIARPV